MIKVNHLQTEITEKLLKGLRKEDKGDLFNALDNILLVKRLIHPDRKRAKDLERDSRGRIIVDITDPHYFEGMDYFRPAALHFKKHGVYTNLPPNSHPMSEYYKFWTEETRRCREGYLREHDGEWITGYHYWYLNYSPILLTEEDVVEDGTPLGGAMRVKDFPHFWDGDYMFFHYMDQGRALGKHGNCLKTRGRGYSFKGRSNLAKVFVLGDKNEKSKSEQSAFAIANEKEFLIKDGILNKFVDNINWSAEHTPWPRSRLKDSLNDMAWQMGYKDKVSQRNKGTLNEVMGVSLKNDPQKARGKRGPLILWEEMGKFPGLLTAWQVARPSVEDGGFAFGMMVAFGTGGTDAADFSAAEELYYNPEGYNIYSLPNVYDFGTEGGEARCAFFHPEYLNRKGFYDEDGNSDVVGCLLEVYKKRALVKYGSSDPNAIVQEKAERPIVPQEAIMRKEGSIFPVMDIKEKLAEIGSDESKFVSAHYVGDLYTTGDGGIKWRMNHDLFPIRDYPLKDENRLRKEGAVEIFQHPIKVTDGRIPWLRYIMGVDPIDDDYSTTDSLGSAFVFDRFNDVIVAEYTGRPATANAFYEIVYRLARYYNALINYENDKKGLFTYFTHRQALNLLSDTPQILKDMEYIKDPRMYGNKAKGTNSSKNVNAWGRRLQADWMRDIAAGETNTYTDPETGEEIERIPLMNLQKIRSIAYLKETVTWNPDGNFDRISAMGMCMILREELAKFEAKETVRVNRGKSRDKFFQRMDNYNRSMAISKNIR